MLVIDQIDVLFEANTAKIMFMRNAVDKHTHAVR